MSHMVIYRGVDGKPGYHQTDDIHDAVSFVEQMRNEEGVEHARIFRLEEVVFEYRPYYRVELTDASGQVIGDQSQPESLPGPNGGGGAQVGPGSSIGDAGDGGSSDDGLEVVDSGTDGAANGGNGSNGENGSGDHDAGDNGSNGSEQHGDHGERHGDQNGHAEGDADGDRTEVGAGKKGLFGR